MLERLAVGAPMPARVRSKHAVGLRVGALRRTIDRRPPRAAVVDSDSDSAAAPLPPPPPIPGLDLPPLVEPPTPEPGAIAY